MKFIIYFLFGICFIFGLSCGGNSENESTISKTPWVGTWQMVGYDSVSVEDSNSVLTMSLDENKKIEYLSKTKDGEVLVETKGEYSINDQHSVLTIIEDGRKQTEYFIRKIDKDSFIFQSDKFSIKWKRIE